MTFQELIQAKIDEIKKDEKNFFLANGSIENYAWIRFITDLKEKIQLREVHLFQDGRSEGKSIIFPKAQVVMILNWIEKLGKNWIKELDKELWQQ